MADQIKISSGVQELISKLRDEGVKAGQDEASKILEDAQVKAVQIVSNAKAEAEKILSKARSDITADHKAAKESLKVAVREAELMLESQLKNVFAEHVKRLVSVELKDTDFLKQIILTLVGEVRKGLDESENLNVILPQKLFENEGQEVRLTEKGKSDLKHFVLGLSGDMLKQGVEFKSADTGLVGLRIKIVGKDVEIDLSDKAITNVLLRYLLPRYRAIVAGAE